MVATCAAFGCTNSCKNSPGFHRISAADADYKLLRQRWIQNIHHADPLPKDENFFVCAKYFKKDFFQRDLKVRNLSYQPQSLFWQYFLTVSMCG